MPKLYWEKKPFYVEIDSYLESGNCILLIQINMKAYKTWFFFEMLYFFV